jgi:molecular chaperone DnaK
LDVTPISLGIVTNGNMNTKLIEANTTIPAKRTEIFTTAVDNQPAVTIQVLQGERPMAQDNKMIGQFNLDGIAPAPRGIPQIEVTFDINADGILSVTAKDKATGKEQHITIDNKNNLSKEEIECIKADAEAHAEEDKKKQEEFMKINQAESYMYGVEASLKDVAMKEKFTEDERKQIEDLKDELSKALEERDVEKIEAAQKALNDVYQPIITRIYKETMPQQQADGAEGATANGNPFSQMGMGDNPFNQQS